MRESLNQWIRCSLVAGITMFLVGSVFFLSGSSAAPGLWMLQNLCQYLAAGIAVGCVADGVTVRVSTELEASSDSVWERLLRKKTFLYLIRGWLAIEQTQSWPDTLC